MDQNPFSAACEWLRRHWIAVALICGLLGVLCLAILFGRGCRTSMTGVAARGTTLLILRQTLNPTPEFARTLESLLTDHAETLRDRGQVLLSLSIASKQPDDQRSRIVARWQPEIEGMPLPVLILLDERGELVSKHSLGDSPTPQDVLALSALPRGPPENEAVFGSESFVDCDFAAEMVRRGITGGDATEEKTFEAAADAEALFGGVEERIFEAAVPIIPRSEWPRYIAQIDAAGGSLDRIVLRIHNQGREGSCTSNATAQASEIVQALQVGRDKAVPLSAISLYKRVGRSPSSGSSVQHNLRELRARGLLPLAGQPFPHTMPHTGFYQPFPAGWEETAKLFRGDEYYEIRSTEGFVTALLRGYPVVYGRAGHAICAVRPVFRNGKLFVKYANSWGSWGDQGYGYDSEQMIRQGASWAFALRSVVHRDGVAIAAPEEADVEEQSLALAP